MTIKAAARKKIISRNKGIETKGKSSSRGSISVSVNSRSDENLKDFAAQMGIIWNDQVVKGNSGAECNTRQV